MIDLPNIVIKTNLCSFFRRSNPNVFSKLNAKTKEFLFGIKASIDDECDIYVNLASMEQIMNFGIFDTIQGLLNYGQVICPSYWV